jgi:hypothetical protein
MLKRCPDGLLAALADRESIIGTVKIVPLPFVLLRLS